MSNRTSAGSIESKGDFRLSDDPQLAALQRRLAALESVVVCFSGGVDSAFVLQVATQVLGDRAVGLTAVSASLAPSEKNGAVALAEALGAKHVLVSTREIDNPAYAANGADRCYHCKSELYVVARRWAEQNGFRHVANGVNLDDLGDYRPGLKAAEEASIVSPLVDAGMRKEDVRRHAQGLGLGVWDKPASACLSSRLPYGATVTRERLSQIGGFEEDLRALGFRQVRVRWHDKIARIEIESSEMNKAFEPAMRDRIVAAGKTHGFAYVTLDLQGYRTGSHNEVLRGTQLRVLS